MHAIIEPSVLIWDKDELQEAIINKGLKDRYYSLSQDLISLLKELQKERGEYLQHKIYLSPEFIIKVSEHFPFNDVSDIFGDSLFDLQNTIAIFLTNTNFGDYQLDTSNISSNPDFLLSYYSDDVKQEVTTLYNFGIKHLENVTFFGVKESSFYIDALIKNPPPKEIHLTTTIGNHIVKYFDRKVELDNYFNILYGGKTYQGILKTGQIMIFGIECLKQYFYRLRRKFNESPKHKPPHGWGTHLFINKEDADALIQNAIWDIEHPESRFLYALLNLFGKNIIHAFPEENIVADNSYHGYPICDKETYIYLQEKYREENPSYPNHSSWQNEDIPSYIRRELLR